MNALDVLNLVLTLMALGLSIRAHHRTAYADVARDTMRAYASTFQPPGRHRLTTKDPAL